MPIQINDVVKTKKKPQRTGKVVREVGKQTWVVQFERNDGDQYEEELKSKQLLIVKIDKAAAPRTPPPKRKGLLRRMTQSGRKESEEYDDDSEDDDYSTPVKRPPRPRSLRGLISPRGRREKDSDDDYDSDDDSDDEYEELYTKTKRPKATKKPAVARGRRKKPQDDDSITPQSDDSGLDLLFDADAEEIEEYLNDLDSDDDSIDELLLEEDPKGDYVAGLEPEMRQKWRAKRCEKDKAKLLRDNYSVDVTASDNKKIRVGVMVETRKRPPRIGEVVDEVGKSQWKVKFVVGRQEEELTLKSQQLKVFTDETQGNTVINIPNTLGEWKVTDAVTIELGSGTNVLTFTRKPSLGLSLKEMILTPVQDSAANGLTACME